MNTFDNILRLLEISGHSQKELADYIGVNKNRITDWKTGRINSYTKYLPQIAEYFNVSVDYLLGKEIPQKEDTLILSDLERQIILSYRLHPNMHESICRLLDIDSTP